MLSGTGSWLESGEGELGGGIDGFFLSIFGSEKASASGDLRLSKGARKPPCFCFACCRRREAKEPIGGMLLFGETPG